MDINDKSDENIIFIWILVSYVIAQTVSAFILSFFINYKRIKWILIMLCTFLFFGNTLYTYGISNASSAFLLFTGRIMSGIAGSILIIGYSQITLCSTLLNRENLIVMFRFITSLGMVIGPLIGLLMSIDDFYVFSTFLITDTNGGSFVMCCLSLLYLLGFIGYLMYNYFIKSKKKEQKLNQRADISEIHEKTQKNYTLDNMVKAGEKGKIISGSTDAIMKRQKYSEKYNRAILHSKNRKNHSLFRNRYVVILLFLYTSCLVTFWAFSAVIVPIGAYNESTTNINEPYNQTVVYAIFAFIGVIYIISFFINRLLNYKIFNYTSFDKRVIVAVQFQCIGYFLLTTFGIHDTATSPYSLPTAQLIFATIIIVIGFGVATLQIPAIYCLITGTKLKSIGIRMSWFFIISSIGRVIGPIFGYYLIKSQNGSIDFLAHLSSIYLLIISFMALIVIMEANKSTAFFPQKFYDKINQKYIQNTSGSQLPQIKLHSDRHGRVQRVPSQSKTTSLTPYSRPRLNSNRDDSNTQTQQTHTNSKSKSKSKSKSNNNNDKYMAEMKLQEEDDDEYGGAGQKKKHFNYSPVERTESTDSIKVNFKPKKTFMEKWNNSMDDDDVIYYDNIADNENKDIQEKQNILKKIKSKSSRLLGKNKDKKSNASSSNIQNPDVGLNDLQL